MLGWFEGPGHRGCPAMLAMSSCLTISFARLRGDRETLPGRQPVAPAGKQPNLADTPCNHSLTHWVLIKKVANAAFKVHEHKARVGKGRFPPHMAACRCERLGPETLREAARLCPALDTLRVGGSAGAAAAAEAALPDIVPLARPPDCTAAHAASWEELPDPDTSLSAVRACPSAACNARAATGGVHGAHISSGPCQCVVYDAKVAFQASAVAL